MKEIIELKENVGAINEASDVFNKISKIRIDYEQENFIVFFLNARNKLVSSDVLFKGGLNSCTLDPRTIFRKALLKNSSSIIVAHNHPSSNLEPSLEDYNVMRKLDAAGKLLQISIVDCIVFNKKEYYCMMR